MKPPLLYVTHRIPYPPNKGDKIRTFHFLQYLAGKFRVYLATFVDDETDLEYRPQVESFCEEVYLVRLRPGLAKLRSLSGLLTGEPLTCTYYRDRGLKSWIRKVAREQKIDDILVSSSGVAPFVTGDAFSKANRVIDFIDVDSEKWRQYASQARWPMKLLYQREAQELLDYERELANLFAASLFVSKKEADLFRQLARSSDARIDFISNGVDLDYFARDPGFESPYENGDPVIVFTGAMDYRPNVDAVVYFAEQVLPLIRREISKVRFYVVGGNPDPVVTNLGKHPGIRVVGRVKDVRPYVVYAASSVAPLRIARGIQNKVLESMALEAPTVVTPEALEGIDAHSGVEVLVGTNAQQFADHVVAVVSGHVDRAAMGKAARAFVRARFSWPDTLRQLERFFPLVAAGEADTISAVGG